VAIKKFAEKQMGTSDVRVDQGLNKAIWSNGVKAVARRVRVRVARCAATPGLGEGADRRGRFQLSRLKLGELRLLAARETGGGAAGLTLGAVGAREGAHDRC